MRWSESFTSAPPPGRYHLGSATRLDLAAGHAVLTPDAESQAGRLFLRELHPVAHFDLSFRGWFGTSNGGNGGGADGIVAVFAPLYDYAESGGGALNFDGCLGYGVEFDTYQNDDLGDRAAEHVAVIKDLTSNHLRSELLGAPTLEDGAWHVLRIRFREGAVEVFVDGQRRLDMVITDFYPFDGFFGFASATGFAFNEHRIDDIALSLPTRRGTDLGFLDVCEGAALDTVILLRNNHPDVLPLAVTSVSLESAPPGAFTLTTNPAPATIAPGEDLPIPLRFRATDAGAFTAILRIDAANGETVYDTIRVIAEESRLAWEPAPAVFPPTVPGSEAFLDVRLRNVGRVPASLSSLRWASGTAAAFTATLQPPAALPATLQPGEALPVRLRFAPSAPGFAVDSLLPVSGCGEAPALAVSGAGSGELLRFRPATPLLLSPEETDDLVVYLDSLPVALSVTDITFELRIPTAEFALAGINALADGIGPDAAISSAVISNDAVRFTISVPQGWQRRGAMFALRFGALAAGPLCRDITLAWETLQPYRITGEAPGRACINPSCRHPEGLYATGVPTLAVSPQPARERIDVHVGAGVAQTAALELYDARGRAVRRVFDGELPAQGGTFTTETEGLSSGYYTLILRSASGMRSLPVLVWK